MVYPDAVYPGSYAIASNPGDLVLDSFLGSGTTAAVAHKMGRRWIGVEMGDHVYTHCIPRLQKVITGNDAGGVTKSTGWLCGGGFKFYELASSLIVKDKYGQQIKLNTTDYEKTIHVFLFDIYKDKESNESEE